MSLPTTRTEFKKFIMRSLGSPVIQINVADIQVEDKIDLALNRYFHFHYDGSEKTYYKYKLTQTDIDNNYIDLPDNFLGVVNIWPINSLSTAGGLFSARYQLVLNDLLYMGFENMNGYVQLFQNLQQLEQILVGDIPIRYNRARNRLNLDTQLKDRCNVGDVIIVTAYTVVDPNDYSRGWSTPWLIDYATALVQEQWGNNLSKFKGINLPGGQQFNGDAILAEAKEKRIALEAELNNTYNILDSIFTG